MIALVAALLLSPIAATTMNGQGTDAAANGSAAWAEHYLKSATLLKADRPEQASLWFYIGQLRARINVTCIRQDPSGGPALLASFNSVLGTPINEWLGADPDLWAATAQRALDWDAGHPDPDNPVAACAAARATQRAGLAALKDHVLSHKDEIRAERTKNGLPNK